MRLGQAFHSRPGPTLLSFLAPFTNYVKPESNNLIDETVDTPLSIVDRVTTELDQRRFTFV